MALRQPFDHSHSNLHRRRHAANPSALAPAAAPAQSSERATRPESNSPLGRLQGVQDERAKLQLVLTKDHPVSIIRDALRGLYEELDQFIEANASRPSPGFGFRANPVLPVDPQPLVQRCNKVITELTSVILTPALDGLLLKSHQYAKDLKVELLAFRGFLKNPSFDGGIPEVMVGGVLESSIMFQRAISDPLNDVTSLSFGVQVNRTGRPE